MGLPNVGKSTLFNALTAGHAQVANYPFTTIDSNRGTVPVPDPRLEELAQVVEPGETTPCFIEFIDIAGLVEGASQGEGLGNQFLGHIREVDAIAHVVRCFDDPEVAHLFPEVDPARDADIVETELLLADLEILTRAASKRERLWKTAPRQYAREEERWRLYRDTLEAGRPLRALDLDAEARQELQSLGLLTGKPLILVANVAEWDEERDDLAAVRRLQESRVWRESGEPPGLVVLSAHLEWELQQLSLEERREFLQELVRTESGLESLVARAFEALDLIRFYTVVKGKLRAWEIRRGTRAAAAAGKIHTDMERGFIRAQVVRAEDLVRHGSLQECHRLGLLRTEGKDYPIQDGDVVEFLFSA